MLVEYNDPEFSKRYTLTPAGGVTQPQALLQVTALAWNDEYSVGTPPNKWQVTDPHIIRMAERYARLVSP